MGRRKIEIKPIRDDRNRSVTFLKRKGGLFKKAHELSVLCQVDVAVVVFGHNKKLYEYSSSDINDIIGRFQYYGAAHEHKGPADFADKHGGGDDDEDDEGGEDTEEVQSTPAPDHAMLGAPMQSHPNFQHLRHATPSGSPPTHNGAMPQFQRGPSPLPPGLSRPSSRTSQHPSHMRNNSSTLIAQQQQASGTVPQGHYAYMPNPPFYNPQNASQVSQRPPQAGPSGSTYPPPYLPPTSQHSQVHNVMMQDSRRSSMPASMPQQSSIHSSRHPSQDLLQPPIQSQGHPSPRPGQSSPHPPQHAPTPSPQPVQHQFQSPPMPQPKPLPNYAKSSIFTPIDDSRSMLAQHWGSVSSADAAGRRDDKAAVAQQTDKANDSAKTNGVGRMNSPRRPSPRPARRTSSDASVPIPSALGRSSTGQADIKRPRLKVQIPSEQSGDETGTGSPRDDSNTAQTSGVPQCGPAHGVVLPPPSPSASALLSAGAQGPPNPFARPAPPMSTNPHAANREAIGGGNHIETPITALPSRFMSDNLLPSPSTFYPEWGFGRSGDNMLPSPLNFQTPVAGPGIGWKDEEQQQQQQQQRKRSGEEGVAGEAKKAKS